VSDIARREGWRGRERDITGYYMDSDCFETVKPVVYQLSAHNGRTRYLAGGNDPYNGAADGSGPAWLSLEIFEELRDAASEVHRLCELYADEARAHSDAYSAGAMAGAAVREAESYRPEALALCAEIRKAKRGLAWGTCTESDFENICELARERIAEIREAIEGARAAREQARDEWRHHADSFADGLASS